jgi:hypothetical protein
MQTENNKEQLNNNEIRKSVLDKIQAGDIHMRSKAFFIGKMIAIIVVALLILLTSAFFVSFISFSLRASGRLILLGFGWQGVKVFVLTFPWGLMLIDLVFVVILERMLRSFRFGYRSPLVYLLGGVLVIVVVGGLVLDEETSLHSEVWHAERSGSAPVFFFSTLYNNVPQPPHDEGVFRGTVVFMGVASPGGPAFFILKGDDPDSDIGDFATTSIVWKVLLPPNMNAADNVDVGIGDRILVAGEVMPDGVHAYGIQKVPNPSAF